MKIKHNQVRVLAAIALQRASERELRTLYEIVSGLSPSSFIELIRDVEDEIENSLSIGFERNFEYDQLSHEFSRLYSELERIRRTELKMPVYHFAELLVRSLREDPTIKSSDIPLFESRRGLQTWINRLARDFSEQQVYRAVKNIKIQLAHGEGPSVWKLR